MKRKVLSIIFLLFTLIVSSQEQLQAEYINRINKNIYEIDLGPNYPLSLIELQSSAEQGNQNSMNVLGVLYREGLGTSKSDDKAFEMILKAAKKNSPAAQYNIGRFYMIGTGCDIDFDKALHWLTLAADSGSEKAAYALGYMYFKGFGVRQDYKEAVAWFELSPWSMAKHYLGLCHYFGYGVEKNEDKAFTYFSKSQTTNSDMFLKHIAENVTVAVEKKITEQINEKESPFNSAINKETITKVVTKDKKNGEKKQLKTSYFNGKWSGKLIELDWSGKTIVRVLPISLEFRPNDNLVHYKWTLGSDITESDAVLEDNALYFQNLNMVFDLPYSENPYSNVILWQVLSSQMEFKTLDKKTYLTGKIQTFTQEWKESGPPMHIILKQTQDGDNENFSAEELIELANQKEHFIALYPNPFVSDVLVEYEMENSANVNINIYDFSGQTPAVSIEKDKLQSKGKYKYSIDGSKFKPGMYIIRIAVGNEVHSRILIKN